MSPRYLRNPEATERDMDGVAFLALPGQGGIFQLNPMGTALWRLLAEPLSADEAADVLHAAFPETPRDQIDADVASLLGKLNRAGLIAIR